MNKLDITITLSRSQARWDSNTWALSLRSDFSPRVTALYVGVSCHGTVMHNILYMYSFSI